MNEQSSFEDSLAALKKRVNKRDILPLELLMEVQHLVELHVPISAFADYCSGGQQWQTAHNRYNQIAQLLFHAREPHVAHRLMHDWWIGLSIEQFTTRQRYPLAAPTLWLANIFSWLGDQGLAFRWMLLTAIHDIQNSWDDSPALQMTQASFGLSAQAAQRIVGLTTECVGEIGDDWARPAGFPEEVLQRLLSHTDGRDSYTEQIAFLETRQEFPVSPGYLRALLEPLNDQGQGVNAPSSTDKGRQLEAIARYLTSLLPGCVPRANLLSVDQAFESDIVVANVYTQQTIISDLFGRYILVECKNYERPVDASRVGYFLHRMRMVHAHFGIIFAARGITGSKSDNEERAARSLIRRAYHEDGSICVVIDCADLRRLADGELSFYWLLHSRYEAFRFGSARDGSFS